MEHRFAWAVGVVPDMGDRGFDVSGSRDSEATDVVRVAVKRVRMHDIARSVEQVVIEPAHADLAIATGEQVRLAHDRKRTRLSDKWSCSLDSSSTRMGPRVFRHIAIL